MKITTSFLFAKNKTQGDYNCFFCGIGCSNEFPVKKIIKKTFTNRNLVTCPSSEYVCANCVATLNENINIQLCTGEIRLHQRVRTYSWVLTESDSIAYTKAHISELRNICLNPPMPPFVIVLADSGKKHLIFRSKVNLDRDIFWVTLEEDLIKVDAIKLKSYIFLGGKMKARMKDNLVSRYEKVLPGEIEAQTDGHKTIGFLRSIENQKVELVFTAGDAFEKNDNNTWLPDCLWDEI